MRKPPHGRQNLLSANFWPENVCSLGESIPRPRAQKATLLTTRPGGHILISGKPRPLFPPTSKTPPLIFYDFYFMISILWFLFYDVCFMISNLWFVIIISIFWFVIIISIFWFLFSDFYFLISIFWFVIIISILLCRHKDIWISHKTDISENEIRRNISFMGDSNIFMSTCWNVDWLCFAKPIHCDGLTLPRKVFPSRRIFIASQRQYFLRIGFASQSLSIVTVWLSFASQSQTFVRDWFSFENPIHLCALASLRKANPLWRISCASQSQCNQDLLRSQSQSFVTDWLCFAKPLHCGGLALLRKANPLSRNWLCFAKPFHRGLALLRKANPFWSSRKMSSLYQNVCISVNNGRARGFAPRHKKRWGELSYNRHRQRQQNIRPHFPNRGLWGVTHRQTFCVLR